MTLKTVLICTFMMILMVSSAAAEGSMLISNHTVWKDQVKVIPGDIIIDKNATLTLDNTLLLLSSTDYSTYGITIKKGDSASNGGKLIVYNGSHISAENPLYNTYITCEYVYPSSSQTPVIQAKDSHFSEMGSYEGVRGIDLMRASSDSYFDNITISNSYSGIRVSEGGSGIYITNSTFDNITSSAIYSKYAGLHILNNKFTNMKFGVYAQYTNGLTICGNYFDAGSRKSGSYVVDIMGNPTSWGNMDRNFTIENNEFHSFQRGVILNNGVRDGVIKDNIFTDGAGAGIGLNLNIHNIEIFNNSITNTQDGIVATGNNISISDNIILNPIRPTGYTAGLRIQDLHESLIVNTTIRNIDQSITKGIILKDSSNLTLENIGIYNFNTGMELTNNLHVIFETIDILESINYDVSFLDQSNTNYFVNTDNSLSIEFYDPEATVDFYYNYSLTCVGIDGFDIKAFDSLGGEVYFDSYGNSTINDALKSNTRDKSQIINYNPYTFVLTNLSKDADYALLYETNSDSGTELVSTDANGSLSFTRDILNEIDLTILSIGESPTTSGTGLSFTPSTPTFESIVGDSTNFAVSSEQTFTSSTWYFNDVEVASGATSYTQNWASAGTHTVRFDGAAAAGTLSRTWTITVPEPTNTGVSSVSIAPSTTVVAPGESFSLDVYIDPGQPLSGSQFNLQYSSIVTAISVQDCGLFSVEGLSSTFNSGQINNVNNIVTGVYSAIVGSDTISNAGSMATVNMMAGSASGEVDFTLSNVVLSDANSAPAPYDVSYATVLVDTAPEFNAISSVSADETESISFTVGAADAEGDDLVYSAVSLPDSATFDANTATFSWIPGIGDAGTYTASFSVTDGYLDDSVSVTITVEELNNAPVITLFEPADGTEFEEGSTVDINVAGTDSDGQSLNYAIKINGDIVSTSQSYSWVTDYTSAGTYTITAIVSDGIDDVSSTHTVTITDLHPRWDVNEDGNVNVLDITLVGQNYGCTYASDCPRWDVNQDGTINVQDLSIVSGHFGETV